MPLFHPGACGGWEHLTPHSFPYPHAFPSLMDHSLQIEGAECSVLTGPVIRQLPLLSAWTVKLMIPHGYKSGFSAFFLKLPWQIPYPSFLWILSSGAIFPSITIPIILLSPFPHLHKLTLSMGSVPPTTYPVPSWPPTSKYKRIPGNPCLSPTVGGNAHHPCLESLMCGLDLQCRSEPLVVPLDLQWEKQNT